MPAPATAPSTLATTLAGTFPGSDDAPLARALLRELTRAERVCRPRRWRASAVGTSAT